MTRVLVVDDEASNVEVAVVICEAVGYETRQAFNGRQAIEIIKHEDIDLVLMDFLMPVLDGVSATREIRSNPDFSKLPILGVTARASHADRDEMLSAGMNDVLLKPYRNKMLLEAMRRVLGDS